MHFTTVVASLLPISFAVGLLPATCSPTKTVLTQTVTTAYVTTITTKAPHSCYTETQTQYSSNIRCGAFNTEACVPLQCFRAETKSIPCSDKCCPTTSTKIIERGCQTACEPACPTVTVSCGTTF